MPSPQLQITTVNVNGIRAAVKQRSETNLGFLPWLDSCGADIVALQEVRATPAQTEKELAPALEAGWHLIQADNQVAKGRAGVALLSRIAPQNVTVGFASEEFDTHGRYIAADFATELPGAQTLRVASLYLPSGQAEDPKQDEKYRFLAAFDQELRRLADLPGEAVICGDWNIAHAEADLKNHKANHKTSGFLPQEREWMSTVFAATGRWRDVVRALHPDVAGPYSWWSYRGKAFDNDAGWRIDYQVATAGLAELAQRAWVDRAEAYDLRWSDHAPVSVVYGA